MSEKIIKYIEKFSYLFMGYIIGLAVWGAVLMILLFLN